MQILRSRPALLNQNLWQWGPVIWVLRAFQGVLMLWTTTQASCAGSLVGSEGREEGGKKGRPLFRGISFPPTVALLLSFSLPFWGLNLNLVYWWNKMNMCVTGLTGENAYVHTLTFIRHSFQQTVSSDNVALCIVLNKTRELTSFVFTAFHFSWCLTAL